MKKVDLFFLGMILLVGFVAATTTITDDEIVTTGNITFANNFLKRFYIGNFLGSLYALGGDSSLSNSNSLFQVIGDDGTPRFQIQNGGDYQASFIARSFMVVNQNNTRLNQSQNNLCSEWGFKHIDCMSSTTGADMGVQDDFEAQGLVYTNHGIYGDTTHGGAYMILGDLTNYTFGGNNGSFDDSEDLFCDYVTSPFNQSQVDNENWILIATGDYEGAPAEVSRFINSSCIEVGNNPSWNEDLTDQVFYFHATPVFGILDGGFGEFYVGDNPQSKFEIKTANGTGHTGFEVDDIAGTDGHTAVDFYTDINGFDGTAVIHSVMDSSSSVESVDSKNMLLELIVTNFNNSVHTFFQGDIIGEKASGMIINLFDVSGEFDNYIKHGESDEIVKAYYDDGDGTITDVTNAFNSEGIDVTLFENNGAIIYIGSTTKFTQMSVALNKTSNRDLKLEYYGCNSSNEWQDVGATFGITDTTNGFKNSGAIFVAVSNPALRGTCNKELGGDLFDDTTNYYYFALKRTEGKGISAPIEGKFAISGSSTTFVLADDYMKLHPVDAAPITCDATSLGAIYFDVSEDDMCVCKSGGWFVMTDGSTCT